MQLRTKRWLALAALGLVGVTALPASTAMGSEAGSARSESCAGPLGRPLGPPSATLSWRVGLMRLTPIYRSPSAGRGRPVGAIRPRDAAWLLALDASRDRKGRCWVKVRLPWRPNDAAGWLSARRALLEPNPWRLVISRAARVLTLLRSGKAVGRARVVVGAAGTPTPGGLFSFVGAWRSAPDSFLGSWVLPLTSHSRVLQEFGGGDGRVGIHGRGGSSLVDPLGSAASHGCIRLANDRIAWLVRTIGVGRLPGTPVQVR